MRRGIWLAVALLLAGCIAPPQIPPVPRPIPYNPPIPAPRYTVYLPTIEVAGVLLGRGLAATYASIAGCQDAAQVGATWLYNWGPFPPECDGVTSLPMTWDRDPDACPRLGPGEPILLWNEPSNTWQWGANTLSPQEAVALTRNLTETCYPARTFATPAEFGGQGGCNPTVWLTAWWDGYIATYGEPPRVSVMATHCYAGDAATCIASLSRDIAWAQARNLPVLVTEWGIVPAWASGEERAMSEADTLLHWMQAQPAIVGEALFAARVRGNEPWSFKPPVVSLFDVDSGAPTAWGRWYAEHGDGSP